MVRPPKPNRDSFGFYAEEHSFQRQLLIPKVKRASVWWNPEHLELKGCFSGWIKSGLMRLVRDMIFHDRLMRGKLWLYPLFKTEAFKQHTAESFWVE